jgi:hypothetical protein
VRADFDDPAIRRAREQVAAARLVVIATPIYKASYSGLLKTFLDLLPQDALRGKTVLALGTGGSVAHLLALDYALKPVLAALGARHILDTVYAVDAQFAPHAPRPRRARRRRAAHRARAGRRRRSRCAARRCAPTRRRHRARRLISSNTRTTIPEDSHEDSLRPRATDAARLLSRAAPRDRHRPRRGDGAHAEPAKELRIGYQKSASLFVLQKAQGTLEKRLAPQGVASSGSSSRPGRSCSKASTSARSTSASSARRRRSSRRPRARASSTSATIRRRRPPRPSSCPRIRR